MAKVTITIQDAELGEVDVQAAFDPPMNPDDTATPAQGYALGKLLAAIEPETAVKVEGELKVKPNPETAAGG